MKFSYFAQLLVLYNLAAFIPSFSSSSFSFSSSIKHRCHDNERSALLQFKNSFLSTNNCYDQYYSKVESWKLVDGESSGDCCTWDGVECDDRTNHVIGLDLTDSCISASISSNSTLFDLVHLQTLNLAYNIFFQSQIPSRIGELSSLTYLNLSCSGFSGQIPKQLLNLTKLVSLDLSDIYGLIGLNLHKPSFNDMVGQLTSLKELHLSSVNISSKVPELLSNFSSLESLRLDSCGLTGEFPAAIFQLPNLKILDLTSNPDLKTDLPSFQFGRPLKTLKLSTEHVPISIGNLIYMEELHLSDCTFTPSSIENLVHLKFLFIWNCTFTGQIPPTFSNFTKLVRLVLSYNDFGIYTPTTSSFSWIGELTRLTYLSLSIINMNGEIPSSWFMNLTQLSSLQMSDNQLTGPLPQALMNLTKLEWLDLSTNQLSGPIPFQIGHLTSLFFLDLSFNKLDGGIPTSFSHLNNLERLELNSNKLTGTLKFTVFSELKNLGYLDLSNNSLSLTTKTRSNVSFQRLRDLNLGSCNLSEFPSFLHHQLDFLVSLNLSSNKMSGELSPSICNLNSLQVLDLSFNNLSGQLPRCLGNFSDSLSVLNLKGNSFHGTIPSLWKNACQLKMIGMSHNKLQGPLPKSLGNCSLLKMVDFGSNQIIDVFPSWFGSLPNLQILILRSNNFYGTVENSVATGFSNLRVIDLSLNQFSGKLQSKLLYNWNAMKVSNASHMTYMRDNIDPSYLMQYDYSMTLYNKGLEMNYMKIPDILVTIDFSNNKFEGEIPDIIGNLKGLQLLNLSGNILQGPIPSSLANLKALECLDLSSNQLSGQIPTQLTEITALSSFDVSFNQLSGPIPQGNQFCNFESKSYEGNPSLWVDTWTKQCGNFKSATGSVPPSFTELEASTDSEFKINWIVVSMGYASGMVIGVVGGNEFARRKQHWFAKRMKKKSKRQAKRR
ncbi:receptor-like protein 6 [Mercurialis annua]|uniref:receptor-like protein 6 n=1 Tax=Mercurialis annua TaxID=3986 RepID=UPI00215EE0C0|nr:receptor-like protein 6 [Mercurialis annua]